MKRVYIIILLLLMVVVSSCKATDSYDIKRTDISILKDINTYTIARAQSFEFTESITINSSKERIVGNFTFALSKQDVFDNAMEVYYKILVSDGKLHESAIYNGYTYSGNEEYSDIYEYDGGPMDIIEYLLEYFFDLRNFDFISINSEFDEEVTKENKDDAFNGIKRVSRENITYTFFSDYNIENNEINRSLYNYVAGSPIVVDYMDIDYAMFFLGDIGYEYTINLNTKTKFITYTKLVVNIPSENITIIHERQFNISTNNINVKIPSSIIQKIQKYMEDQE